MFVCCLRDVEEAVTALRPFTEPGTGQLYELHRWLFNLAASRHFVTPIKIRERGTQT